MAVKIFKKVDEMDASLMPSLTTSLYDVLNHNYRNNDRMEWISVPNDVEFPLVVKNCLKSDGN